MFYNMFKYMFTKICTYLSIFILSLYLIIFNSGSNNHLKKITGKNQYKKLLDYSFKK